jgi:hypothetical protein
MILGARASTTGRVRVRGPGDLVMERVNSSVEKLAVAEVSMRDRDKKLSTLTTAQFLIA